MSVDGQPPSSTKPAEAKEPPRPTSLAVKTVSTRVPKSGEVVECFRCGQGVQIPENVPKPDKDNDQGIECTRCHQILIVYSLRSDGKVMTSFATRKA